MLLVISIAVSIGTFTVVMLERWDSPSGHKTVGIMREVENLPLPVLPTQDGDEKPESGESDTDACESDAGVHEK